MQTARVLGRGADSMSYADLLKDPRWQRKRLEVLEAADWTCSHCAETSRTLHVHHMRYIGGKAPWEYDPADLAVLCDSCHELVHSMIKDLEFAVSRMPIAAIENLLGYAAMLSWWGDGFQKYPVCGSAIGGVMAFVGVHGREGADVVLSFCDENKNVDIGALLTAHHFNRRFF